MTQLICDGCGKPFIRKNRFCATFEQINSDGDIVWNHSNKYDFCFACHENFLTWLRGCKDGSTR